MQGVDPSDYFGKSIALSDDGHVLAVGVADTEHPTSSDYSRGQVHVYAWNGYSWDERYTRFSRAWWRRKLALQEKIIYL